MQQAATHHPVSLLQQFLGGGNLSGNTDHLRLQSTESAPFHLTESPLLIGCRNCRPRRYVNSSHLGGKQPKQPHRGGHQSQHVPTCATATISNEERTPIHSSRSVPFVTGTSVSASSATQDIVVSEGSWLRSRNSETSGSGKKLRPLDVFQESCQSEGSAAHDAPSAPLI
jgi:hypothetical protein